MTIVCTRCMIHPVKLHGQLCDNCKLEIAFEKRPPDDATDNEVIHYHTQQRVLMGCRECKTNDFGYEAGIKLENWLKYFIII